MVRGHNADRRVREHPAVERKDAMAHHTLPEQIVAAVAALAEELGAWCVEGRDRPLAEHEEAVLERVRRVLPRLLGAVVAVATSGLHPRLGRARAACPACGRKAKPHQPRARHVTTRCGTLELTRPWYHCGGCGHGWSVVETTLAVAERARVSEGLRAWLVRLGAATDFREAAALLAELTGLAVGAETLRRHTEQAGAALRAAEDAAAARAERTRDAAEPVEAAPGLLRVEADGAMVRYLDGWHEVKVGLVAGWDDGAVVAPSYVAAREPAERFGGRLLAEAARRGALEIERWAGPVTGRGLAVLREAAMLGDGAAWIWNLADEHLDRRVEIVDAWHAAQHLRAVATALCGEGERATAWAAARTGELLAQGAEAVLVALRGVKAPTPEAAAVLRVERGYFAKNAARMQYPQFRLDGLPIGSGAIESAADHVVQRRMKRAGMRWSEAGGDALLALRARLRSGRPLTLPTARADERRRRRARAA
jgi:hypothetical protein